MNAAKHKWTKQEEALLSEGVRLYGCNWQMIRDEHFPALSALSLKNKYYNYVRTFVTHRRPDTKATTRTACIPTKLTSEVDIVNQIRLALGLE
ncbi:Myb-like DNA-binding domain-containing protein [Spironucleus salmonicida]|nr:Myb-like DNA-binding domain-containing protein [Spironucleus salmonicida]|eukprot:EST48680.1 Myb-like DNA-binding domain-containing protein [Spironucleus salmonicida]